MDQNIFELAKKVAALSPGEGKAAVSLFREHGYKLGDNCSAIVDMAKALISVWDGKASTLDQAAAWRSVWAYCATNGLVRGSMTSNVEEVIAALDNIRGKNEIRDDRASAWLVIWDYVRCSGLLSGYDRRSPVKQVLGILGDYRRMQAGAEPLVNNEKQAPVGLDTTMHRVANAILVQAEKESTLFETEHSLFKAARDAGFKGGSVRSLIICLCGAAISAGTPVDASKRMAEEVCPTPMAMDKALMNMNSVKTSMGYFRTDTQQDELVHGAVILLANSMETVIRHLDEPRETQPIMTAEAPVSDFDKDIQEIKKSCYEVIKQAPKAFTHCESSALIEKLASTMFNLARTMQIKFAVPRITLSQEILDTFGALDDTDACLAIGSIIRSNKQQVKVGRAEVSIAGIPITKLEDVEPVAPVQEQVYDPYKAKPCHTSHELYKTGDADAPEQIKDRNGEVVLDQCRNCGRAESELLDGEPCMNAPMSPMMSEALEKLSTVVEPDRLEVVRRLLVLQDTCYGLAERAGWWKDLGSALEEGEEDGDVRNWEKKHLDNWISAKLMLIVTEVAEAMEGHRKGLKDDKLPHRGMLEVELADAVIRIMDLAGGLNMDVAGAIVEKLAYNMSREDHKIENRMAAGGKSV